MAAEVQDSKLNKVDSAIADDKPASPTDVKDKKDRRTSSTASNVHNIADLGMWLGGCMVTVDSRECKQG
jgi:hypothetical protein